MKSKANLTNIEFRSHCPVSRSLDLVGDKWTLLIMRDALVLGRKTFAEFANSPERIPTNLLADRLKKLVNLGLLSRQQYHQKPPRYVYIPTQTGLELRPVLFAMKAFGEAQLEGKA